MRSKTAFAILVAAVYSARVAENQSLRKKNAELSEQVSVLVDGYLTQSAISETLAEKARYLFDMCEKHDVEFDEFDCIVLTHDLSQE